jgi:hypothetical protein
VVGSLLSEAERYVTLPERITSRAERADFVVQSVGRTRQGFAIFQHQRIGGMFVRTPRRAADGRDVGESALRPNAGQQGASLVERQETGLVEECDAGCQHQQNGQRQEQGQPPDCKKALDCKTAESMFHQEGSLLPNQVGWAGYSTVKTENK